MTKIRFDHLLIQNDFFDSRETAQRFIRAGKVLVNETVIDKPGTLINPDSVIRVQQPATTFAGRGGDKLDNALEEFQMDVQNLTVADLGASTGGFTDCLLKRGVKKVYAVDVGRGQLIYRLQTDPRVIVMDSTNCRHLNEFSFGEKVDLVVGDLSFISLKTIFPAMQKICKPNGNAVLLIKPQFEVGKGKVGKKGIVRNKEDHKAVLTDFYHYFTEENWHILHLAPSKILGKTGNMEFLIHITSCADQPSIPLECVEQAVERAHKQGTKP